MRVYVYALDKRSFLRIPLGVFISFLGLLIIFWVAFPILSFEIFAQYTYGRFVSPLPDEKEKFFATQTRTFLKEAKANVDYTKASNWFPVEFPKTEAKEISEYTLSIPKLGIFDAKVLIGGEDLNKSLIHFGGTGLPGKPGKGVIFGHSVLPQFFNPKDYKTIFSTLPTLSEGDEIFVTFDNVTYKYVVISMRVVDPDDISVLEQEYDDSYLSLVTCVPPGTYWKRLIVKTRLVKI